MPNGIAYLMTHWCVYVHSV